MNVDKYLKYCFMDFRALAGMPNIRKPCALAVQDSLQWFSSASFLVEAKLVGGCLPNTFFMFCVRLFALGNFLPGLLWCTVESTCLHKSHVLTFKQLVWYLNFGSRFMKNLPHTGA
jgi:hypothetical protein